MVGSIRDVGLSAGAREAWAKTHNGPAPRFELDGWLPLYQHLDDAAGVAAKLWDEWVPRSIIDRLADAVGSIPAARDLVVWLAGVHDVGKVSPAFAVQVPVLADPMRRAGLSCDPSICGTEERARARHELVSYLAVRRWLIDEHGFDASTADGLASVTAAHHGRPADTGLVTFARDRPHLVGERPWEQVRDELLRAADRAFTSPGTQDQWRGAQLTRPTLVLLSGLVIVADWIASSDLFPPARLGAAAPSSTEERVAAAWRDLDFPRRWNLDTGGMDASQLLRSRFALPPGSTPHPAQAAFVEMAQSIDQPELMILESEMGSGKTEAALSAAEVLAARFGMSGVFVGLPTQATADGMFSRVIDWAERLGLDTPSTVFLAHSRSSFNRDYARKKSEAFFRSIGDEYGRDGRSSSTSLIAAHRWFSAPRRGPLSNFVVGTVDQALFAALQSRYVMLRHLALASKVVIIDEVHAYDVYMREYFVRLLEWLGAYDVPVILLSATLPSAQRRRFIEAYDRGRRQQRQPDPAAGDEVSLSWAERVARKKKASAASAEPYRVLEGEIGYPAISRTALGESAVVVTPPTDSADRVVHLRPIDDDLPELISLLREALREGGNVAVIRNTVRRAQETAAAIRDAFADDPSGVTVTLAHSRFLAVDRARKDAALLAAYGRHGDRPYKSIVVATQVIEQSLDIDFDLMVTDAAPIDLLLQRAGRLHRHAERDRPAPLSQATLMIVAEDWSADPPVFDGGSSRVYAEAILLRTAAVLRGRDTIRLPGDIPTVVEAVYGGADDIVPLSWRDALDATTRSLRNDQKMKQSKAASFLMDSVREGRPTLIGWLAHAAHDPETTPPGQQTVRDVDETLEVIMLQRDQDGSLATPDWIGDRAGVRIPVNEPPGWRLTQTILGCSLRLPIGMCRGDAIDRHIKTLERAFELPEWQASHALKGELVLVVDADGHGVLNEFDVRYTPEDGFFFERRER